MYRSFSGTLACLTLVTLLTCSESKLSVPPAVPPISKAVPAVQTQSAAVLPHQDVDPNLASAIRYFQTQPSGLHEGEIEEVARAIIGHAQRRGIDPNLVMALIHIESSGNNFALSPVGAMGLMQIMPATAEELARKLGMIWTGPQMLFDPIVNVALGIAYLDQLANRFEDTATALAAYNWGPGHINSRIRQGLPLPVGYSGAVLTSYTPKQTAN